MELTPEQIKNYHRIIPDPEEQDRCCIFIELGPFAGITVAFGRFQMADKDNDDGTTKARYEYEMIGIPPDFKDKEFTDEEGEEFEYMLGYINYEWRKFLLLLYPFQQQCSYVQWFYYSPQKGYNA